MSAPISPGGFSSVSASGSAATQASAPAACSAAIGPAKSGRRHRCPDTGRSPRRPAPARGRRRDRRRPPPSRTAPRACGSPRSSADGSGGRRRTRPPSTSPPAGRAPSPPRRPSPRRAAMAFATSSAVRSQTMVWKFSSASSRPWRNLRLIRSVGRVPGRVLQDVALDHRRGHRAVVALPDQAGQHPVLSPPSAAAGAAPPARRAPARSRAARPAGCRPAPSRRSARRALAAPTARASRRSPTGEGPMWRRLAKS